ncbi:hypothetical protein SAMN05421810_11332 [Amycolatopsis arida]|uniref:SRPBCC family protein n=1 Tax=Amycolatopsis arida TaxID=587909 RepID=A0A1I6AKF7_9PSEU|nr:SRPBCC family protein [Amycolatopsis arida]TDX87349.1 hypothetical protein CLV69_11332 [Amycolatopsis arida]SFQ69173.1 hypothetical protein SAMN05421810_11332 [Amycolatopsis arida]
MRDTERRLAEIPGLVRYENVPRDELMRRVAAATRETYSREEVYGRFCTLETHIDCPPEDVFTYLADVYSHEEFTYSVREVEPVADRPGLFTGWDTVGEDTRIYMRVDARPEALTVDYHSAWDQGDDLWMVYLFRIVPAEVVLKRPGSVLLWTNCHHPYYAENPYPELAPPSRTLWVGDLWSQFAPGHQVELDNLRAILEHRHRNGIPIVAGRTEAAAR